MEFVVHILGGRASSSETWLIGLVLVVLLITMGVLSTLYKRVDELTQRVDFSIQYYRLDADPGTKERTQQADLLYSACAKVIESAREDGNTEILAVNSFVEIGGDAEDGHADDASKRYLDTLNKKLGKVRYRRIIQLPEQDLACMPSGAIGNLIAPNYRDHYKRISEFGEHSRGRKAAIVDAVRAKYPISFVVVTDKSDSSHGGQLIWQMDEHVHEPSARPDSVQITGVFIVNDPNGIMVKTFVDWFEELTKANLQRVTVQNLD